MALIRWEPARELQTIQQEMNRLFGTFFDSQAGTNGNGGALRRWIPAMDLVEEGDQYVLRADLPGVREQDVKVELDENVLTVSGERHSASSPEGEHEQRKPGHYRVERATGRFSRSLVLPDGVEAKDIRARIEHGVLEVTVAKPQQRQPHRVTIDVAGKAIEAGADDGVKQATHGTSEQDTGAVGARA